MAGVYAASNQDGHLLRTYDFEILTITPFSKSRFVEGKTFFSPERRSKVVKFTKNDRLDPLIVLARDERFSFFP